MSTLRVNTLQNTATTDGGISIDSSGHVTVDGVAYPSEGSLSGRNRIINGDMRIDQRNAGAAVTPSASVYFVDRWLLNLSTEYLGVTTVQQNLNSLTPPNGFTDYIGVVVDTGTSPVSNPFYNVRQLIEGFNVADLGWGTANAKTVTLSFWVRASITGTYTAAVRNSAPDRSYVATYTISSADTWEYKTITIPGDTSGTWLTDNGAGITLSFGLANNTGSFATASPNQWNADSDTGATSAVEILSTTGATFYITGVQLEAGSVATPFEHRSYGQELSLCQRYYEIVGNPAAYSGRMIGAVAGDGNASISLQYIVTKRDVPTLTDIDFQYYNGSAWTAISGFNSDGTHSGRVYVTSEASNRLTRGQFAASAEL